MKQRGKEKKNLESAAGKRRYKKGRSQKMVEVWLGRRDWVD